MDTFTAFGSADDFNSFTADMIKAEEGEFFASPREKVTDLFSLFNK